MDRAAALKREVPGVTFLMEFVYLAGFYFYSPPQAMLVVAGGSLAVIPSEPAVLGGLLQRNPSIYSSVFHAALAPYFGELFEAPSLQLLLWASSAPHS